MEKVQFLDQRQTTDISLPSYPGSIVKVYKTMRKLDRDFLNSKYPDAFKKKDNEELEKFLIEMIRILIKEWNFVLDGIDVDITNENISMMPDDDRSIILATYRGISLDEFKKQGTEKSLELEKKSS